VGILLAACLAYPAPAADLRPDSHRLQGNWTVLEVHRHGKAVKGNDGYTSVTIGIEKVVFNNIRDEAGPAPVYHTDPFRKPKHFDLYDEKGKQLVTPGIYELNGDSLKICRGNPRPTEFQTKPNDGRMLFLLKRAPENKPRRRSS
jgi:uncharacterized protein (TIGR03067 family)